VENFSIITTLVTAFGLALIFGWFAERFLKTPALVGFIMAGVAVTLIPGLPPVDRDITAQFTEIGVILLMFGVGLHFSVADLIKVKGVAVTGAVLQMLISGTAGTLLAHGSWDWDWARSIVFGLTLSCASTVVVTKALEMRRLTTDPRGQVAIGWLIVQDLVTVFIMVCLPLIAQLTFQNDTAIDPRAVVISLSKTLFGLVIFVAGMLIVGRRVFPWILSKIAALGSRELFTLCVLTIAIGIAYGAGAMFNVSFALGAFFAGMVMRESDYAHRAAKNSLPLQDAFAVLFFVSVGLMLDWHVFLRQPLQVLGVMLIIMLITSTVSALLVLLLRWPLDTALTVGACVSQIGEFSYILCAQGISLKLADSNTMSLIVAASIMTIALNPVMFAMIPKVRHLAVTHVPYLRRAAMRETPMLAKAVPQKSRTGLSGHVVVVGVNDVARALMPRLEGAGVSTVYVTDDATLAKKPLEGEKASYFFGDPLDPMTLVKSRIMSANFLVLPENDPILNKQIIATARQLRPDLNIFVRTQTPAEAAELNPDEHTTVICDVTASMQAFVDRLREEADRLAAEKGDDDDDDDDEIKPEPAPAPAPAPVPAPRRSLFARFRSKVSRGKGKAEKKALPAAEAAEAKPEPTAEKKPAKKHFWQRLHLKRRAKAAAAPAAGKADAGSTRSAQAETAAEKAEPVKAEPVKAEPVKAEPAEANAEKAEPVKAEPEKTEPAKAEPEKAAPEKPAAETAEDSESKAAPAEKSVAAASPESGEAK
jgi:CPA2 family monovalent cation:H+ antiporter-2